MRAAQLRKQPDAWDIPTLEDDAETQIYFNPSPESELPALNALPPARMSLPVVGPAVPVLRAVPPPVPQPRPLLQPVPMPQPAPMPMPVLQPMPGASQRVIHTHRVPRTSMPSRRTLLILIGSACVALGTLIGAVIAVRGSHAQRASGSLTPGADPAPVVVTAPPPAPAPIAKLTVTPIEQPAPAKLPDTRNTIIVTEPPAPEPQQVQAVQPAPRHRSHAVHHVAAPVVVAHAAPAPAHVAPAPVASGSTGTLDLSTKPPCDIVIDGHRTGFSTPHRGIALSPGRHEVTLTNADAGIQLTTEVTVTAGQSVRMIRDFTK